MAPASPLQHFVGSTVMAALAVPLLIAIAVYGNDGSVGNASLRFPDGSEMALPTSTIWFSMGLVGALVHAAVLVLALLTLRSTLTRRPALFSGAVLAVSVAITIALFGLSLAMTS